MTNEKPCDECGFVDPVTLHRYPGNDLGIFVYLCNRCVLGKNVHKFCIICFDLLDEEKNASWSSLPAADTKSDHATCICCPAKVHLRCLPSSTSSGTRYFCPRCINTSSSNSFKLFDVKKTTTDSDDDEGGSGNSWFTVDLEKQLQCATEIAVVDLGYTEELKRAWDAATAGKSTEEIIRIRDWLLDALRRMGINSDGDGSGGQRQQQAPRDATLDLGDVAGDNNAAAAAAADDDAEDRDAAATDDDAEDRDAAASDDYDAGATEDTDDEDYDADDLDDEDSDSDDEASDS